MKNLFCFLLILSTTSAIAAPTPVKLNPETLRTLLLTGNNGIMVELNHIYQAKDNLNIGRAKILPSVNLSVVTSPSFLISGISSLLSFLMPSNWLNLREEKRLLSAEEMSYYILELNQYASVYAMYETYVGDTELRAVYEKSYENLEHIYQILKKEGEMNGTIGAKDLAQAHGQAEMAKIQVDATDLVLSNEKSDIRQALGLAIDQDIQFEVSHTPISLAETGSVTDIAAQAIALAPENIQLDFMIAAAKAGKWSKLFNFFSSSTLGSVPSSANSTSLDKTVQSNSLSIGFGMIPNFQLSNDNIDALRLQKEAVALQAGDVIEKGLNAIDLTKNEEDMATQAETNFLAVYNAELLKYKWGLTDLLHVLTAENQMTSASVARVLNQLNLDNLRINIHRALLTDQFAKIQGCGRVEPAKVAGGFLNFFGGRKVAHATIDEACRAQATEENE